MKPILQLTTAFLFLAFVSCNKDKESENPIANAENKILQISIDGISCQVNHESNEVILFASNDQSIDDRQVVVRLPQGAQIVPSCDDPIDFTEISEFQVTAENGDIRIYSIIVELIGWSYNNIQSFTIEEIQTTLSENLITLDVYQSQDISALTVQIELPVGASISPDCSTPLNFNYPFNFIVTAENGDTKYYEVAVNKIRGMNAVSINMENSYEGQISETNQISFTIPYHEYYDYQEYREAYFSPLIQEGYILDPNSNLTITNLNDTNNLILIDPLGNREYYPIQFQNTAARFETFEFPDQLWTTIDDGRYYAVYHPNDRSGLMTDNYLLCYVWADVDLTNISPSLTISENASIDPIPNEPDNYYQDKYFTITSETGIRNSYGVRFVRKHLRSVNDHSDNINTGITSATNFFTYYWSYSKIASAKLINDTDGTIINLEIIADTYSSRDERAIISFEAQTSLAANQYYYLDVILENEIEHRFVNRFVYLN